MIKFKMVDGATPEQVRYAVRSRRKLIGYLNLVKHQTAIRVSSRLDASVEHITRAGWQCEWLDGSVADTLSHRFWENDRAKAALYLANNQHLHDPLRVQVQVPLNSINITVTV